MADGRIEGRHTRERNLYVERWLTAAIRQTDTDGSALVTTAIDW